MAVKELFAQLHEVAAAPKKQLEKYLAEGKKVVAVAPVYTPQEIIHSMGMVPMGVWGADMELNEMCIRDRIISCLRTIQYELRLLRTSVLRSFFGSLSRAVSYTHLDVYKRQILWRSCATELQRI